MAWIKLVDTVPELDQCVLIAAVGGAVGEARYIKAHDGVCYFVDARDPSYFAIPPPTHWMPLPDPPTIDQGDAETAAESGEVAS